MKMLKYYLLASCVLAALTIYSLGSWLMLPLAWFTVSVSLVTFAYATNYPHIFRKHGTGTIPWYITWLFWPYLGFVHLYNAIERGRDVVDTFQPLTEDLFVACRLFPSDVDMLKAEGIEAILDVTAEFDGLNWSAEQQGLHYLNIPVLDHQIPTPEQLAHAMAWIEAQHKLNRKVVVHCALGRGRSVFFCTAYLLLTNPQYSVREALEKIQNQRETARLNKQQLKGLTKLHQNKNFSHELSAVLIVNPVSGSGKWSEYENEIVGMLTEKYRLSISLTEKDTDVSVLAQHLVSQVQPHIVIAGGGDGTLASVAHGIYQQDTLFGILPLGTANSLATVLLGPMSKLDPINQSCEAILAGKTKAIDIMHCNGRAALLVAAVGFGQEMIERASREEKNHSGQLAYIRGLWQAVSENKPFECQVSFDDGEHFAMKCVSLVVANAAPKTTILAQGHGEPIYDDGLLDVTILPAEPSGAQNLTVAELILPKLDDSSSNIRTAQCEKINIAFATDQHYALDGEILSAKDIEIKIHKHALDVAVP
ncbi:diacylglycerol kinase family protein [Pseudoalteromonas sp. PS5]|uniref:diacylglycerol kinase family protein n=1 Tax=Pseudoalteromonas sp. PS5 TaxID=1437473 RepID=UPI000FFF06C6|nr:diacylglycerol kinase family protein [Pseudoalteromonas sp. PS5]RXF05835.1 hypothetical protein D9603_03210 [Pseudoalteromonas sp. PS5]